MRFGAASKGAGLVLLALLTTPLVSANPLPGPSIEGNDSDFDSGTVDGTTGANNTSTVAVILASSTSATATSTPTETDASTAASSTALTIPTQSSTVAGLLGFTNSTSQTGLDYLTFAFEEDGLNSTLALAFAEVIQFQSNVWKDLNSRFQSFQSKQIVTIALLIGAIAGFLVCGIIYSLYQCISCCRRRHRMQNQRRIEERNSFTMVSPSSSTLKRGESRRTEKLEKRPFTAPGRWPIDSTPQNKGQAPTIGLGIITPASSDRQRSSPAESHEMSDRSGGFSSPTPSSSRGGGGNTTIPYPRHGAPRSFSTNLRNASGRRSPHPNNGPFPTSSTLPAGQLSAPPVLPSTITTSPSFSSTFSNSTIGGGPALTNYNGAPPSRLTIKHLPPSASTPSPNVPSFPLPNSYSYTNNSNNNNNTYSYNHTNPHAKQQHRPSISRPLTGTSTLTSIGETSSSTSPSNLHPPTHQALTSGLPPTTTTAKSTAPPTNGVMTTTTNGRISDILAEFDFDVDDEDGKDEGVGTGSGKGSMETTNAGDDLGHGGGVVVGDGESQVGILAGRIVKGKGR